MMKKKEQCMEEELEELTLFRDNERYRDDVFVCVNGESCLVQRGQPVRLRRCFAEVLRNSERQDRLAEALTRAVRE